MMFMVIRIMLSRMMRMMIIMFIVMQMMLMKMLMMMMPIFQCSSCGSASDHIWGMGFCRACLEGIFIFFTWMVSSYISTEGYPVLYLDSLRS